MGKNGRKDGRVGGGRDNTRCKMIGERRGRDRKGEGKERMSKGKGRSESAERKRR